MIKQIDKRIHIVHILPGLPFGGAERLVINLVNTLDPKKFRSSILLFREDNPMMVNITNKEVDVFVIPKKGKLSLHLIRDLKAKLNELHPDVVHTHLFGGDVWGRIASKKLGIPVVTTEHNMNVDEGMLKDFVKRILRKKTDKYIACSKAIQADMQKRYALEGEPIEVIYNGIEVTKFLQTKEMFTEETVNFLILGRLEKQKGHTIALKALQNMAFEDWRLRIVGNGSLKKKLDTLVDDFALNTHISFDPALPNVLYYMDQADIVLIPSLWEGLGVVALEALASKRIVIASNTGGLQEIIEDGKTGILFETGNDKALEEKIHWVMNNPEKARKIAQKGRDFVQEQFSLEKMVQAYAKVYTTLCQSK
ncbi:MAG: glycosyltransferase family 4 protein [Candidatus Magasanikbacteria bacterium]